MHRFTNCTNTVSHTLFICLFTLCSAAQRILAMTRYKNALTSSVHLQGTQAFPQTLPFTKRKKTAKIQRLLRHQPVIISSQPRNFPLAKSWTGSGVTSCLEAAGGALNNNRLQWTNRLKESRYKFPRWRSAQQRKALKHRQSHLQTTIAVDRVFQLFFHGWASDRITREMEKRGRREAVSSDEASYRNFFSGLI